MFFSCLLQYDVRQTETKYSERIRSIEQILSSVHSNKDQVDFEENICFRLIIRFFVFESNKRIQ